MGNSGTKNAPSKDAAIKDTVIKDTGNTPGGATNGEPNGEPGGETSGHSNDDTKQQSQQTPGNSSYDAMYDILTQMGYGQYFQTFIDEGFENPKEWHHIELDDLIEMGMKKGHAKIFIRKVKELQKNNDDQTDEQKKQGKIVQIIQNGEVYNYSENNSNNNMEQKDEHKDEHKDEQKNQTTQTQNNQRNNNNINNKPPQKKKCSLLFVGETGVGKSTLLKSFEDFINGIKYEDVKVTPKCAAKGQSQTQESSQYQLSNDEWAVNIIDTPGIGDTAGFSVDQQHLDNIINNIGEFGDFNAVCILIKRGTTRKHARISYIIGELKMNMPKDVKTNFITIMTRSDVPIPDADTLSVIKGLGLPVDNIIPINNGAYEELDLSQFDPESPIRKGIIKKQKADYIENHFWLQNLLDMAYKMEPYQGKKILDLKLKRDALKENVWLLKKKIDDSFKISQEITDKLDKLKHAKTEEEQSQAWKLSTKLQKPIYWKENGKITTNCTTCTQTCHIDCGLSYGDDLNMCSCACNGKCYKCGCSMSLHAHVGWKSKIEIEIVEDIDHNKKLKWENAKDRKKMFKEQTELLKKKKADLEAERKDFIDLILQKYNELQKIAIIGYNENFGVYVDECMEAVKKDPNLTTKQKKEKQTMFQKAKEGFNLFKKVVMGGHP